MKKIILLSGKAEHGKTTAAEILVDKLTKKGKKVIITRYAYYLKDLAKRYFGWDGTKNEEGRELLQKLGTNIIREALNKPTFHVNRICEDIEIAQDEFDYFIIDDTRFPNEIYYPKAMFGEKVVSVRIKRMNDDETLFSSKLTEEQKRHQSEVALDDFNFDYVISAKNIEQLEEALEYLIKEEWVD